MTQKEIIDIEQSAFAFCTRIKAYNVLRKESKTLGRDILYIGFPQSTLDKVLSKQMFTRVDEEMPAELSKAIR